MAEKTEAKVVRRMFDKERDLVLRVRGHLADLRPLRFNVDSLLAEVSKGGERARDILTLVLYVEDLAVALTETIGEAEDTIGNLRNLLAQAQRGERR